MVEIRVVVPDAAGVHGLLRRLAAVFDRASVSFDGAHKEVRVRSDWESRAVVHVVDAVEAWLEEDGAAFAKLWMGDRSYTLVGPVPVTRTP
jgi:hypothetical protein